MGIKSIRTIKNLRGRRVLLRVDFNVPLTRDGRVGQSEDYRLLMSVPTIKYLTSRGAKVIIMAHLGRPDGKVVARLRLTAVAKRLSQLVGQRVGYNGRVVKKQFIASIKKDLADLKNGEVFLLENISFNPLEEKADVGFAQMLAGLGEIYVNDGFAVSHRDQASVSVIQKFLPSYAGLLLEQEVNNLTRVLKKPRQPLVVIIGGAKISTKIKVIKNFLPVARKILLGGALANTVLKAKGISVGKSLIEPEMFKEVAKIKLTDNQVMVPVDAVLAKNFQAHQGRRDAIADVRPNEVILDVGPDTIKLYGKIVRTAKMIVWNGPMGLIENPTFARGTREMIKILSRVRAETIVGGGETVQMIRKMKLEDKFDFISTGGGAMLEFLEGKRLPGLKKLIH